MKLIFLHIPKAGGTTLESILTSKHRDEAVVRLGRAIPIAEFKAWPASRREAIDLLLGHFPFGLHEYLGAGDIRYVTIFRDPVERAISHYYYVRRHPSHFLHQQVVGQQMSLMDFIQSDLTTQLDNGQVRLVAGCEDPDVPGSDDLVDDAIAKLERWFTCFGILERFDESMILFKHALGWDQYPVYRSRNTGDDKENVGQDVRDVIRERNRYDQALYEWACAAFGKRLENIEGLESSLETLRTSNAAYVRGYGEGRVDERAAIAFRNPVRRVRRKIVSMLGSSGRRRRG